MKVVASDGRVALSPSPDPGPAPYVATAERYERFPYQRCGRSGLLLPPIALGLWQGFGHERPLEASRAIVRHAFDCGITHFDLANNYGPPPGSAEEAFGHLLATDLRPYRDELIVSTKAGWGMWPGPYGDWGSRKYLLASLDASLRRLHLEYVDIYYSHRLDPETPLEETMGALDAAVRQGKALYVGISSYPAAETREAVRILRGLGTPAVVHQPQYSLLDRRIEPELLGVLREEGLGCVVFSPLAQGLLAGRYLDGVPAGSRASQPESSLGQAKIERTRDKVRALAGIARRRGQTLAQMALAWVLRDPVITSAVVGVSSVAQLDEDLAALGDRAFASEELAEIDRALA